MEVDFDVTVIGAGPAGLTLALLLARRGHSVALLDKWPRPYPLPRAVGVDHESFRTLRQAGIDARVKPLLQWDERQRDVHYLAADGEILMHLQRSDRSISGWPPAQGFDQPDFEGYLEQLAIEHPRINLMRNVAAYAVEQDDQGVSVGYRSCDRHGEVMPGAPELSIRSHFAVGCDGANSFVSALVGTGFESLDFTADWLVVDLKPHAERDWYPYLGQVLDPARPTTLTCAGPGSRRFEFQLLPGETREEMTNEEQAWRLLEKWDVRPDNTTMVRVASYTFQSCWATSWSNGRVAIAGDAAHLTPPFLGQGFNSAIRDALNLAVHLDLIIKGIAPLEFLKNYSTERREHVRVLIERAVEQGRIICVTDPQAAEKRNEQMRAARASGAPSFVPSPPVLGPGTVCAGSPLAGTLSHHGWVVQGEVTGFFDDVCANGVFVLIGLDGDPAVDLEPAAAEVWSRLGGRSFHLGVQGSWHDMEGVYESWLGSVNARVALVRPDYYVFGTGVERSDANRLVVELGVQLGLVKQP
jgi:resorcinol 4-hydroxylase (NADPH)